MGGIVHMLNLKGPFFKKLLAVIFLWCFLGMGWLFGQTYNFHQYTVKDGLPYSNVYDIQQGDNGYIWMGTGEGLTRFNGRQFKTYTTQDGLAENSVTAIAKAENGDLWLGHQEGGVSIYKTEQDTFIVKDDSLISDFVKTIYIDTKKRLWLGTAGGGVFIFKDEQLQRFTPDQKRFSENVLSITEDYQKNIWFGTSDGVFVYDHDRLVKMKGLPTQQVRFVFSDSRKNIWIGNYKKGVTYIPVEAITKKPLQSLPEKAQVLTTDDGLGSDLVYCVVEDREGKLWFGTLGGGISKYNIESKEDELKGYFENFRAKNGLSGNKIWTLATDKEGNIWVGTIGGGATHIPFNYGRFELYGKKAGLKNNLVWSITQDQHNQFWIGTNNGFVRAEPTPQDNRLMEVYNPDRSDYNYTTKAIFAGEQKIWLGTYKNKLCYFPQPSIKQLKPEGLHCISVHQTVQDFTTYIYDITSAYDKLWIAFNNGIMSYEPGKQKFQKYVYNVEVYDVFKDQSENLWMGTKGKGLIKYDGATFTRFKDTLGLKHDIVYSITQDEQKNIWIGTRGGGLYRFDGNRFSRFPLQKKQGAKSAFSVINDDQGNIWMGTSTGIYKFDQNDSSFHHYGESEGFLGLETNINAVWKDDLGNLWFGTVNGAVKYNPKKDKKNVTPPETHITGLKLFYEPAAFPSDHKFSYQDKQITFEYTAISLANPGEVRYQHKLVGFNQKWSPVTEKTSAEFSNLPPGNYTFKVRACNGDGIWNETPAAYQFTVTPPFWMTWWFYAACAVFAGLAVYVFTRWRTYRIRKEKKILEGKVRERTQELQHQKEKIEEANQTLAQQKDIIEQKNIDITDSIKYAQRIQQAILPELQSIKKAYPNSFVFYKPKDIVSGDFYFFEQANGKDLIAAVDCTGHGVPGALMSMIGNNVMTQIIKERRMTDPGKILNHLDDDVATTLKKETDLEVNDGMDLALCTIDKKKRKLYFGGALRPLYLIRDKKLHEYKGNKFSIGGHSLGLKKNFQKEQIDLKKGDCIYIFSDGFPDQFGGPKGKKFMTKRFKRLLVQISDKPMKNQQKVLEEQLTNWMAQEDGMEQIDDVLVIGIKFE